MCGLGACHKATRRREASTNWAHVYTRFRSVAEISGVEVARGVGRRAVKGGPLSSAESEFLRSTGRRRPRRVRQSDALGRGEHESPPCALALPRQSRRASSLDCGLIDLRSKGG